MSESSEMNPVMRFFSNPIVGILGSIASLIGLLLAVIFFMSSQKQPDLVYSVHPTKNTLIRSDIPTNLSVLYKGSPIKDKDVVVVTLSLWNEGEESIKSGLILDPLRIKFTPEVEVLEASILKSSRSVTGLELKEDEALYSKGIVPLNLRILENYDGGNIQLLYAGPEDSKIELLGTIEGQGTPRRISSIQIEENKESPFNDPKFLKWILPGILLLSVVTTGVLFIYRHKLKVFPFNQPAYQKGAVAWVAFTIAITPFLFAAGYLFIKLDNWYPPFGF